MSREKEFKRNFPGLETYVYNFAYIYKYAKLHDINLNSHIDEFCKESNGKPIENLYDINNFLCYVLKDEMKEDSILESAVQGIKKNQIENRCVDLLSFFGEMSEKELSEVAFWNMDTSIYNENTPESLIELSIGLLESNNHGNKIMDLGTCNGNFLINYTKTNPQYSFNGIEVNFESSNTTALRLAILGVKSKVRVADEFFCENEAYYDKVFSNPPFMQKATEVMLDLINKSNDLDVEFTASVSPDWLFVEKARQFINHNGKAVCIVLDSSLSKKTDNYIRKRLVEEGWVEAVIALPSKVFSYSNISSSILVLSRGNKSVRFIDATKLYEAERRINIIKVKEVLEIYESIKEDTENSKTVTCKELIKDDCILKVESYLDNYKVDLINPVSLDAVTESIFRGYRITAKQMDNNRRTDKYAKKYKILNVGNINGGVIDNNLDSVYMEKENLDKYLIKNGDILLTCKTSKIKIALYESENEDNVIASGNIIVIRPNKKKIRPAYLRMFLDSEKGQKLLNSIQTGATIISINTSALKEMPIPLLDNETQQRLAIEYMSILDNLNMHKKKILELEDEIKNFSNDKF